MGDLTRMPTTPPRHQQRNPNHHQPTRSGKTHHHNHHYHHDRVHLYIAYPKAADEILFAPKTPHETTELPNTCTLLCVPSPDPSQAHS